MIHEPHQEEMEKRDGAAEDGNAPGQEHPETPADKPEAAEASGNRPETGNDTVPAKAETGENDADEISRQREKHQALLIETREQFEQVKKDYQDKCTEFKRLFDDPILKREVEDNLNAINKLTKPRFLQYVTNSIEKVFTGASGMDLIRKAKERLYKEREKLNKILAEIDLSRKILTANQKLPDATILENKRRAHLRGKANRIDKKETGLEKEIDDLCKEMYGFCNNERLRIAQKFAGIDEPEIEKYSRVA